ncbi:protein SPEC3-like [Glandiceps talaboti]
MQIKCAKSKAMMGKWMSMLPCMHMCWAWTCAIINWIVPGLGTMVAAFIVLCPCCSKHPTCADRLRICCINFWFGLFQLITMPIVIGSIIAAYWGWFFVAMSYIGYHNAGGAEMGEIREVMTNQPGGSKVTPGDSKAVVY